MVDIIQSAVENMQKKLFYDDMYILKCKKTSDDYDEFHNRVNDVLPVTNEEMFKQCYWTTDFERQLLRYGCYLFSNIKKYITELTLSGIELGKYEGEIYEIFNNKK